MAAFDPAGAARWLAEAFETGNPLAPLPAEIAPRDMAEGEEAAFATLEALGFVPCGLRLLRHAAGPLVGPMLEARLIASGAPIAAAALRHAEVTGAVVGVLAAELKPEGRGAPRFARLHPALDIAATRFAEAPADAPTLAADLARLGLVVAGAGMAAKPGPVGIAFGAKRARPKAIACDLAAGFAEAAAAARRLGGLPKGALLVIAGLTPPRAAEGALRARFDALGTVEAAFG
jgi:hypothetical protein